MRRRHDETHAPRWTRGAVVGGVDPGETCPEELGVGLSKLDVVPSQIRPLEGNFRPRGLHVLEREPEPPAPRKKLEDRPDPFVVLVDGPRAFENGRAEEFPAEGKEGFVTQGQGAAEGVAGPRDVAERFEGNATVQVCDEERRVHLGRLLEVGEGLRVLLREGEDGAEHVPGAGVRRGSADGLACLLLGFGRPAERCERGGELRSRLDVVGADPQHALPVIDRGAKIPCFVRRPREVPVRARASRVDLQGALPAPQGFLPPSEPVEDRAEVHVGVHVKRLDTEPFFVEGGRFLVALRSRELVGAPVLGGRGRSGLFSRAPRGERGRRSSCLRRGVVVRGPHGLESRPRLFLDRDQAVDLVRLEAERHGTADSRQHRHVVELDDHPFELEPVRHVARAEVDHPEAAPCFGVFFFEPVVEGQPGKRSLAPLLGKADERPVPVESKPSQVAGAERHGLETSRPPIHVAELSGARVQDPEPIAVDAGGMRHREALENDLVVFHVDDTAPRVSPLAPAGHDVGAAHGRHVGGPALGHRKPVQVAAVLGREARDERRLPDGAKAVAGTRRGQATVERVDEHGATFAVDGQVVNVEVPGGVGDSRHVESVVTPVLFAPGERVLETPDLVAGAHVEVVVLREKAHGPFEVPFEDRKTAVGFEAHEKKPVRLVGREGQAQSRIVEPRKEMPRRRDAKGRFLGHGRKPGGTIRP
ncbi:MAG: hypothetical protein KatS3mg076_1971 [Candidatus Binatia bacterium]|nr:MAG: hypothetical protein KatS3mg076_1971 [Candidatus Binatia bacterium]